MARFELKFAARASKDLRGVPKTDVRRIMQRIVALQDDPRPVGAIKLAGRETFRVRQGHYRILYDIFDTVLVVEVIQIGHRRDVYRN
ncbi:MAG: type II toxin-antitoxin system RelE/ParE family toxin [Xanthomonadales bacterium PRO7]|nr:type II toxin-antitoxin system RelE/ParE family toxin [Xanthomonadales bacterium PRO7]